MAGKRPLILVANNGSLDEYIPSMPCPWCNNESIVAVRDEMAPTGGQWAMYCRSGCGAKGPDASTKREARLMWSTVTEEAAFNG